jgi:phosphoribosylanthranilate isomerase
VTDVKFCGLTRGEDARVGATLRAAYLGVIFAGGPRRLDAAAAGLVLDAGSSSGRARRVGVFGNESPAEIAAVASVAKLDVAQLHGSSDPHVVDALRKSFGGAVWRVVRMRADTEGDALRSAGDGVDGVVVDALVDGVLGGTGVALDWERLARVLDGGARPALLVLAGGLRPENVERAIGLVAPDVVDVSSGVETAPGIKDHAMMRAFAEATARGGR